MASSGNFAVLNPLKYKASSYTTSEFTNGNLVVAEKTGNAGQLTFGFVKGDGKYYFEIFISDVGGSSHVGVCIGNADLNNITSGKAQIGYRFDGSAANKLVSTAPQSNSTQTSYGDNSTGNNDIVGVAVDFNDGTINFYRNNTAQGSFSWSDANNGDTYYPYIYCNHGVIYLNTGQDSSFVNQKTSGSANASDENGFGDFYYTPPSGYVAMCSANLPISSNIDPAETDTEYPAKQFNAVIYTGTGTSQSVTGVGFQPDLVWIKERGSSGHNVLTDSSRGVQKQLEITDTEGGTQPAESTNTDAITAFGTDGFTAGGDAEYNGSTKTYVAWCWKANGGTTSTNTEGTHTCTLQANTNAGFSIMTLANYTSATGVTIGHGLGAKPTFYIHKSRSSTGNWHVYHQHTGATKALFLNQYSGGATAIGYWNNTEPTSTVLSLGNTFAGTSDGVVYAWTDIKGYSKFGTYEGNNEDDNGPYEHLGFRPRYLVIKGVDESYGWYCFDSARDGVNRNSANLSWFPGGAETDEPTGARKVDFLSNGFRVMADAASINGSGDTYIYMAWGDIPAKYSSGFGFVGTEE